MAPAAAALAGGRRPAYAAPGDAAPHPDRPRAAPARRERRRGARHASRAATWPRRRSRLASRRADRCPSCPARGPGDDRGGWRATRHRPVASRALRYDAVAGDRDRGEPTDDSVIGAAMVSRIGDSGDGRMVQRAADRRAARRVADAAPRDAPGRRQLGGRARDLVDSRSGHGAAVRAHDWPRDGRRARERDRLAELAPWPLVAARYPAVLGEPGLLRREHLLARLPARGGATRAGKPRFDGGELRADSSRAAGRLAAVAATHPSRHRAPRGWIDAGRAGGPRFSATAANRCLRRLAWVPL